ncbi:hypothetical protein OTU49_004048, partial [Cherax quadricarinatus]
QQSPPPPPPPPPPPLPPPHQHSQQYSYSQHNAPPPLRQHPEQLQQHCSLRHQEQPQHQDQQFQQISRPVSSVNNAVLNPNLTIVAATTVSGNVRNCSGISVSVGASTGASTSSNAGAMAGTGSGQSSAQTTVMDNTPPTTPESIISNISDSPRGDTETAKLDDSSKSGRDSSEVELECLGDTTKLDQFSEDSNTMDSTLGSEPRRRVRLNPPVKRQHEGHLAQVIMADGEGSETEEGPSTPAVPKRRRRGPRARASNDPEDEEGTRKGSCQGAFIGRRRRRHSSSRGDQGASCWDSNLAVASGFVEPDSRATREAGISSHSRPVLQVDDDPETSGLSALSLACSAARRSRYNFCQELDPDLDASKRIAVLQSRIQELKRTYMQVKTELASVERRRKKLRRKEREKESKPEPT